MQDTWKTIETLVSWLDANSDGRPPEVERLLRVLKLGEEVGEVNQALAGALGTNPRKGASHSWTDVSNELVDVILTAMVALRTIDAEAAMTFQDRVERVAARSLASGIAPTPPGVRQLSPLTFSLACTGLHASENRQASG